MSNNYLGDRGQKAVKTEQGQWTQTKNKMGEEQRRVALPQTVLTDWRDVIDYTHLLKFPQVLCLDSQIEVAESSLLTNPLTVYVVVLLLASFLRNLLTF